MLRRDTEALLFAGSGRDLADAGDGADHLLLGRRTPWMLEERLAGHTGQSQERISADIERDKILEAPQALEYGLVDRIIPSRKTSLTPPAR